MKVQEGILRAAGKHFMLYIVAVGIAAPWGSNKIGKVKLDDAAGRMSPRAAGDFENPRLQVRA